MILNLNATLLQNDSIKVVIAECRIYWHTTDDVKISSENVAPGDIRVALRKEDVALCRVGSEEQRCIIALSRRNNSLAYGGMSKFRKPQLFSHQISCQI